MSNSQLPPNPEAFNRAPHRQAIDFIIDSKNRDKNLYPDSNDIKIHIPQQKNVRNIDICHMIVPKVNNNGKFSIKSGENDFLLFNEGIILHHQNKSFSLTNPFTRELINFDLPQTLTGVKPQIIYENMQLILYTEFPHNFIPGESLSMIGFPYVEKCAEDDEFNPNRQWKVVEVINDCQISLCEDTGSICAPAMDLGILPPISECAEPTLVLPPHENEQNFAKFVEKYFNYKYNYRDIRITIDYVNGKYELIFDRKSDGARHYMALDNLLSNKPVNALSRFPSVSCDVEDISTLIESTINPPTIVKNVSDKFGFTLYNSKFEVTLNSGVYTTDSLILAMTKMMNLIVGDDIFFGKYDSVNGVYQIESQVDFGLCLKDYPEFADVIGFFPIDFKEEKIHVSQCKLFYPTYSGDRLTCRHFRTKNTYSAYYDPKKDKTCIIKNGKIGTQISSMSIVNEGITMIKTSGPHGFEVGDLINITQPISEEPNFESGMYLVLKVCSDDELVVNMKICEDQEILLDSTIYSIDLPFNLDIYNSSLNESLGFEKKTILGQTCYCSTKNCSMWDPPYLLVHIDEFPQKLQVQYQPSSENYENVYVRLDCDRENKVFKLTKCKEAFEDLLVGKTYNFSTISIKLKNPDGSLYDTQNCDWSMWIRFVKET